MRRLRYHRYHCFYPHQRPQWRRRRRVGPLLVLLAALALTGAGVLTVTLVTILALFGPFLLFGVGSLVVTRHLYRRRRRAGGLAHSAMSVSGPAPHHPHRPPVPDWHLTRTRFAQLRSEYGQFECDPLAVLRLPALTDVTVPSTARFVDAFAQAQALDTDTEPPAAHCAQFATAVDQAWRAWQAARDAAERIRLARVPASERASVQRTIKLLTIARDSGHDAERIAAYAKARTELAKLNRNGTLRLPPAAAATLDAAARGQLPVSKTAG